MDECDYCGGDGCHNCNLMLATMGQAGEKETQAVVRRDKTNPYHNTEHEEHGGEG